MTRLACLTASIMTALLLTAAFDRPISAQAKQTGDDALDFVFLAEARPLLIRVRVNLDGKPLSAAWDNFITHLFRVADVKGKGYLEAQQIERAPLLSHVASGELGSMFGGMGMNNKTPAVVQWRDFDADGDGKVTLAEFAACCRKTGLAPFQIQAEAEAVGMRGMVFLGAGSPEPSVEEISAAIFGLLDAAGTGKLTKADLAAAPERLLKLDANEDEMLTVREIAPKLPAKSGGMMGMTARTSYASPLPTPLNPNTKRVLMATASNLVAAMQLRYADKDRRNDANKLSAKALGLDDKTFAALDSNGDGLLDAAELAGFVKRVPDLEFAVNLGADPSEVELVQPKAGTGLAERITSINGVALLDLPATRVELRGENDAGANQLGAVLRLQWTAIFKQADKNGDGALDENEARANGVFSGAFKAMDKDGDGKVTEQEFNAYLDLIENLHSRAQKACVALVLSDESRGLFDLLDVNRDGRLSVREMRGAVKLLAKLDRSGQGYLLKSDLPRSYRLSVRRGPASVGADDYTAAITRIYGGFSKSETYRTPTAGPLWFRKMDKNRDGDVSRREWLGTEDQFREIDTDADGLISAEEAERYDAAHRGRR